MKNIFALLLLLAMTATSYAQKEVNIMSKAADSDKEATAILDKVRQKHESLHTMEVDFSLVMEIPEQAKNVQKGKMIQEGEKYHLELPTQTIISDGKVVWVYLKNNNEVQVNDVIPADEMEEEGIMSPKDLFRIYEKGDYVYALVNQISEKGKLLQQIEFKPISKDSEYSKLRVSIDKKNNDIVRIKAFYKDGTRYTLNVSKLRNNLTYPPAMFAFNAADYPDVYVVDLRD